MYYYVTSGENSEVAEDSSMNYCTLYGKTIVSRDFYGYPMPLLGFHHKWCSSAHNFFLKKISTALAVIAAARASGGRFPAIVGIHS